MGANKLIKIGYPGIAKVFPRRTTMTPTDEDVFGVEMVEGAGDDEQIERITKRAIAMTEAVQHAEENRNPKENRQQGAEENCEAAKEAGQETFTDQQGKDATISARF